MIMATIILQNLDAAGNGVGEPRSKNFMASAATFNKQGPVSVDDLNADESNLKIVAGRKAAECFLDLAATLGVSLPLAERTRLRALGAEPPMGAAARETQFGISAAFAEARNER